MARREGPPTLTMEEIQSRVAEAVRAADPVWNFLKSKGLSEEELCKAEGFFQQIRGELRLHQGERILSFVSGVVKNDFGLRPVGFFKLAPIFGDNFELKRAGKSPVLTLKTGCYSMIDVKSRDKIAEFHPYDLPFINVPEEAAVGELAIRQWRLRSTGHGEVYRRLWAALEQGLLAKGSGA